MFDAIYVYTSCLAGFHFYVLHSFFTNWSIYNFSLLYLSLPLSLTCEQMWFIIKILYTVETAKQQQQQLQLKLSSYIGYRKYTQRQKSWTSGYFNCTNLNTLNSLSLPFSNALSLKSLMLFTCDFYSLSFSLWRVSPSSLSNVPSDGSKFLIWVFYYTLPFNYPQQAFLPSNTQCTSTGKWGSVDEAPLVAAFICAVGILGSTSDTSKVV